MTDIFTKAKRSEVMSAIRCRGNKKTEVALVKLFRNHGITGWRRHTSLPGKPDFSFRANDLTVFVDGCFWHGCPRCYKPPKSNCEFWDSKIAQNKARDRQVGRILRAKGWTVLRIWQHDLTPHRQAQCLLKIQHALRLTCKPGAKRTTPQ